jgi:pyruvate dehydrogenase E2 component (dihydrolipoamide acetyltransferase)
MAKLLEMPKLSPTMEEGVLTAWHKREGDAVGIDDLLAEVETDKATMEFRSFDKGTLRKLLVTAGSTVKLGQAVAILGDATEDISALLGASAAAAPKAPSAPAPGPKLEALVESGAPASPAQGPASAAPEIRQTAQPKMTGSVLTRTEREPEPLAPQAGRVLASPFVRKTAREQGLDLADAQGTGPFGRILPEDLQSLANKGTGAALARTGVASIQKTESSLLSPESVPLSPMRKTIARRLTESKQTVPHFYLTIDVDVTELSAFRENVNRELAEPAPKDGKDAPPAVKVSINDILIKACALALARVPECNASFTPEALLFHKRVDISVAVAIPDGLVTPVVRNADQKSIVAIAKEVRELASKARQKKLRPDEMQDGTFSISNLGMFGIDAFSAVINPPEGAILAVGQIREEPVVRAGAIVPGKKLSMTLSCDHRVVDGAVGASFLAELRALLEKPMRILTG